VGSGAGAIAAAYGAVAGGAKLYGAGGFWDGVSTAVFLRLRPALRVVLVILMVTAAVFLLPLALALLAGVAFPFALLADVFAPGFVSRMLAQYGPQAESLRSAYLVGLAVPAFALAGLSCSYLAVLYLRQRRRFAEGFESPLDPSPVAGAGPRLWRSPAAPLSVGAPRRSRWPALCDAGGRQPGPAGFRELIVRAADLDTGGSLALVLLEDAPQRPSEGSLPNSRRSRVGAGCRDLRAPATMRCSSRRSPAGCCRPVRLR
jgi:hypothetical protein